MALITQYSRIQHKGLSEDLEFTIPANVDYTSTTDSWVVTDLADREIGINMVTKQVFVRIGEDLIDLTAGNPSSAPTDVFVKNYLPAKLVDPDPRIGPFIASWDFPVEGVYTSVVSYVNAVDPATGDAYIFQSNAVFTYNGSPAVMELKRNILVSPDNGDIELRYVINGATGKVYLTLVKESGSVLLDVTSRTMIDFSGSYSPSPTP